MAQLHTSSGELIPSGVAGDTRGRRPSSLAARTDRRAVPSRQVGGVGGLGRPGNPAAKDRKPVNPLALLHALLRGRYALAITAALLLGAAGAIAGYASQERMYTSNGLVEVTPYLNQDNPYSQQFGDVMPLFELYIGSQASLLSSEQVARIAVTKEAWDRVGTRPTVDEFLDSIEAGVARNSTFVGVSYTHPRPDVAQAGVESALDAYKEIQDASDAESNTARIRRLENLIGELQLRQQTLTTQENAIVEKYGAIGPVLEQKHFNAFLELERAKQRVNDSEAQLQLLQMAEAAATQPAPATEQGAEPGTEPALADSEWNAVNGSVGADAAETGGGAGEAGGGADATAAVVEDVPPPDVMPAIYREYARLGDREFTLLYNERVDLQDRREQLRLSYAERARPLVDLNTRLRILDARLASLATFLEEKVTDASALAGGSTYAEAKAALDEYKQTVAEMEDYSREIGQAWKDSQDIARQRANVTSDIQRAQDKIAQLEMLREPGGRVEIISEGDVPTVPSNDRRVKFAMAGGFGGMFLGIGLFALYGLFDGRLRWLDDPRNADILSDDRVLAALPDMKGGALMAGDDEAVAFQLHKLRLILQRAARAGRRSFAITSPVSGDGKTSVTLALGLSLSASGTRTLLIDFDLVGKSLSRRFGRKMNEPNESDADNESGAVERGVGAILRGAAVEECFRPTEVNRLDLLSCADAVSEDARRLSPRFARHVLREALEHYEVVLIDTGPLLASLEANLIAGETDGTVLCVSRGTDRNLVKRSVQVLSDKGSVFEGIVINRLDAQQFDKHVASTMSMSVPQDTVAAWRASPGRPAGGPTPGPTLVTRAPHGQSNASNGHNGNGHSNGYNGRGT